MAVRTKDIIYKDFPIAREVTSQGEMKTYTNSDALSNAIKIWLVSAKGEKIRATSGGYLLPYIGKPLDDDYARRIASRIVQGLREDFSPPIVVMDIKVIPDTYNRRWLIGIKGYNADLDIGVNTTIVVDNS